MLIPFLEVVVKVAIIGAGMSGMGASFTFGEDVEHIFIEARNRTGGRIASSFIDGVQVQTGAEFIHADRGHSKNISKVYDSFGWKMTPHDEMKIYRDSIQIIYEGKGVVSRHHQLQGSKIYNNLCEIIQKKQEKTQKPLSLKEAEGNFFQNLKGRYSQGAIAFAKLKYNTLANEQGANLTDLGVDNCEGKNMTQKIYLAKGGYSSLVQHIWKKILKPKQVYLNETVTKIDYSGDRVRIYTKDKVFIAERVVFTLSLGVLRSNNVEFVPKLSEKQTSAFNDIGFGIYNKVYVSFDKPFWDVNKLWVSLITIDDLTNKYSVAHSILKNGKYILKFYVNDQHSRTISNFTEEELRNDLLTFLKIFYPHKEIKIIETLRTNWHLDPYAYGSYSYDRVGKDSAEASKKICPTLNNKIWFVGEHCHPFLLSFSHGAFQTGMWAAGNITESFKQ